METTLAEDDFQHLQQTLATNNKASLLAALEHSVQLYRSLRKELFTVDTILQQQTEEAVMVFWRDEAVVLFFSAKKRDAEAGAE